MATIGELKDRLVERLAEVDLEKLGLDELRVYADVVKKTDEMMQPDPEELVRGIMETMKDAMAGMADALEVPPEPAVGTAYLSVLPRR